MSQVRYRRGLKLGTGGSQVRYRGGLKLGTKGRKAGRWILTQLA